MEQKLSLQKFLQILTPQKTETSNKNPGNNDLRSLELSNQATFTPTTFDRWEGARVEKNFVNNLEAVSSDQNCFYSPLENVSASPIDTIRSLISPC